MGFVDHIASKMAFFPPTPATYTVKRHSDNGDLYISPTLPCAPACRTRRPRV